MFPVRGQRGAGLGVALESWPRSQEALLPAALPQKQWKSETFSSLCFHCKQGMKAGPWPPGAAQPVPPPCTSLPSLRKHLSCPLCPRQHPLGQRSPTCLIRRASSFRSSVCPQYPSPEVRRTRGRHQSTERDRTHPKSHSKVRAAPVLSFLPVVAF